MPVVSVMMPVYNAARTVGAAVESVLGQTYPDWELIAVNDGSSDDSAAIIQGYADRRIRLIHQEHAGEGAARNHALQEARGAYIAFLDADDWLLPEALKVHVEFLEGRPEFQAAYSDGYKCDDAGAPLLKLSQAKPALVSGNLFGWMIIHPMYGVPCAASFRSAVARQHRLRFDESLTLGTDWDFFIQLAEVASFGYIPAITCKYRLHSGSISAVLSEKRRAFHARIQRRVMGRPSFEGVSLKKKKVFFYQLLVMHLNGNPRAQEEVFASPQFASLPPGEQGELYRLVAGEYLLKGSEEPFTRRCLQVALALDPGNLKHRLLWRLFRVDRRAARATMRVWRLAASARRAGGPEALLAQG